MTSLQVDGVLSLCATSALVQTILSSILGCMFPACPFCLNQFFDETTPTRPAPPPPPHAPPFRREELVFLAHLFIWVFFYLSHGLWVAVWAVDTGYGSLEHDGDLRAGPNQKDSAHLSLCISERHHKTMQHLKPWRALLLFAVLCQPGVSDKYGKVIDMMMMVVVARSLLEITMLLTLWWATATPPLFDTTVPPFRDICIYLSLQETWFLGRALQISSTGLKREPCLDT